MKRLLLILCLWACGGMAIAGPEFPWKSGERLIYDIHWGMAHAARATFEATQKEGGWSFDMELRPRGLVQTLHPFRIDMGSGVTTPPWRTQRFYQDRREKPVAGGTWDRLKQHTITFDHPAASARFVDPNDGRDIVFDPESDKILDLLSMLYYIRQHDWANEDELTVTIANRYKKPDRARVRVIERIEKAIGPHRKQPIIYLSAEKLPTPEEADKSGGGDKDRDNKKDKHRVTARVWATDDDAKIPLLARVKMKFGTITVRLKLKDNIRSSTGTETDSNISSVSHPE